MAKGVAMTVAAAAAAAGAAATFAAPLIMTFFKCVKYACADALAACMQAV